ncbi:MAG: PSD1 and planctomycete cytochrome C domain-containing protein [Planctomycetota bacterium]
MRLSVLAVTILTASFGSALAVDYSRDVKPILAANCFHCHGQDEEGRGGDLRLDVPEAAMADLGGYSAIVPGAAGESEVIVRIEETDPDLVMPKPGAGHKLTEKEIQTLRRWIDEGAEYEPHWAFTPPARDRPRGATIDKVIQQELQAVGLEIGPPADRATLIRRLSLDLRGLPPTVEEVDAFVADHSANAYEALVDRLLASPHAAERLAVEWLDTARYADTNGFSIDDGRFMWAWRDWVIKAFMDNLPYDQFLTKQLAGDLLADGTEQDLLATGFLRCSMNTHEGGTIPEEYRVISIADKVDAAATAFLGLTMRCAQCHDHKYDPISQRDYYRFYALFNTVTEPGHGAVNGNTPPVARVRPPLAESWREGLERRIDDLVASRRLLYPKLAAARDAWEAIERDKLTADFRRVAADVPPGKPVGQGAPAKDAGTNAEYLQAALNTLPADRTAEHWDAVNEAFAKTSKPMRDFLNNIDGEVKAERKQLAAGRVSSMVMDHDPTRVSFLLERGQYDKPADDPVEPGAPASFGPDRPVRNRLELAKWLADPTHPLTARVAVNRFWQVVFGTGLVETSEDFGVRAPLPSHPELLDWLAVDFIDHGWDVRRLLKQMVMSDAYRQSATPSDRALEIDPTNRLLSRSECRRLPAEAVRDNALAVAGMLDISLGGPPVLPPQPAGLWREISHFGHPGLYFTAQAYHPSQGARQLRRSLYTYWKRTSPPPTMAAFDAPTRETCVTRRGKTTTPLQALVLWNEPQFVAAAQGLAERAVRGGGDDKAVIDRAFRIALSRPAREAELEALRRQLQWSRGRYAAAPEKAMELTGIDDAKVAAARAPWTLVATTIINLHEFNSRP